MKKIISYNVNGIRAAMKKGLLDWIKVVDSDIICIQETKTQPDQIPVPEFEEAGYHSFRAFNQEPHQYTWWSFRANARAKNLGWHIDYNMVNRPIEGLMRRALILPEAKHSDHCPATLEMDF